jgi:hypothetical protein
MRKILSLSALLVVSSTQVLFAASGDGLATSGTTVSAPMTTTSTTTLMAPPPAAATDMAPALTAAPNPSAVAANSGATVKVQNPALGSSLGEYKTVSCASNSVFSANSCNQCFDGGSVKVGERLTGLFDNWTNNTSNVYIAYKEEQKTPTLVKFSNSSWSSSPSDESKMWRYGTDIIWISSGTGGKTQYILPANQKVKFLESELGAGYTLEKTTAKNGEAVGLVKFPVVYHTIDSATASEGPAMTHYECALYNLSAPVTATGTTATGTTVPKAVTETKTGPETLLLMIAAFFIAFGMMFSLRKKV